MKRILLSAAVLLVATGVTKAQTGKSYQAERAGVVIFNQIEDKYNAEVYNLEAPNPDGDADKIRLAKAKELSAKMFPRKAASKSAAKTTAVKLPVVNASFAADSLSGIPPDNDMAVSKGGKAVNVMNSNISVLDANSGTMTKRVSLKGFSQTVGLNNLLNDNRYDPKVQYDPVADRFICVMLNGRDQYNYIVVGFSVSNDPEGGWAFYKFYGDYKSDTTWFDYPGVAITKDELFITGNKIKHAQPWETGFTETVIYQINKQEGYDSAATLNYKIWDGIKYGGQSIRNLFPVRPGWNPDSDEQYFVSNRNFDVQNDTIFLAKVSGKLSSSPTISVQALKAPKSYGVPPNGRQEDTFVLNTNDGRILGAYAMYDEIQFVSTSVHPQNGAAAIYHGKIGNYKTSPSLSYTEFIGVDTLDFGYPNISFVGNEWGVNQSMITFNYTGQKDYAGLAAVLYDGTGYSDMVRVKTGDTTISILGGKNQRWGDYTGTQVDYNSLGAVWIVGIYGKVETNDGRYGNWIAKLNSPALSVKETNSLSDKGILYPNPAMNFVDYKFNMQEEALVSFEIYDVTGKVVDVLLTQKCKKGQNLIRFNIASLPTGSYILSGTMQSGKKVMTEQFVKN